MSSNTRSKSQIPIAVVGMSCRLPEARDAEGFWNVISNGVQTERPVPPDRLDRELYFDPKKGVLGKTYSDLACLVDYRPPDFQRFPHLNKMADCPELVYTTLCEVASEAVESARINPIQLKGMNAGVYVGHTRASEFAGDLTFAVNAARLPKMLERNQTFQQLQPRIQTEIGQRLVAELRSGRPVRDRDGGPLLNSYLAASLITECFDLRGPYMCFNSACASSLNATVQAMRALQLGTIDAAFVGGASFYHADTAVLFSQAQSLSGTGSRPFDEKADGLIIGEGYVVLILKTLDRALADGNSILGVLSGAGISSDGKGKSLWAPREEGQILAIQRAYECGRDPAQLQYIEAHATSTQVGDATEIRAISKALEGRLPSGKKIPISSVKANVGHTLEVAGLAGLMKVLLCLQHETIPATTGVQSPNSAIPWENSPFTLPEKPLEWTPRTDGLSRCAAVNAFGIGGLNVHLIVDDLPKSSPAQVRVSSEVSPSTDSVSAESDLSDLIAIVGTGAVLPGIRTASAMWEAIQSGQKFIGSATPDRWDGELYTSLNPEEVGYCLHTRGGYVRDFEYDWKRHKIPPRQLQNASPLQFMILDSVDQAIQQSGIELSEEVRGRAGVIVGSNFGGAFSHQLVVDLRLPEICQQLRELLANRSLAQESIENIIDEFRDRVLEEMPALLDETGSFTSSSLASRVTKSFDLMGGAFSLDAGMVGAGASLACAVDLLRSGDCDLMICVAGSENLSPAYFEAWTLNKMLSRSGSSPVLGSEADGCLPGEGCTTFLLKRYTDALADGDSIKGVVHSIRSGTGENLREASQNAISAAWKEVAQRSELWTSPDHVRLIELAAVGNQENDSQSLAACGEKYRRTLKQEVALVSSCVGQIGHLSAASGGVSLLHAIQALGHEEYPSEVFAAGDLKIETCEVTSHNLEAVNAYSPRDEGALAVVHFSNSDNHSYHILFERGTRKMNETSSVPTAQTESRSLVEGVIHYDATEKRRQSMRVRAAQPDGSAASSQERVAKPVAEKAPVPSQQTVAPLQNGSATPATGLAQTTSALAASDSAQEVSSKPMMSSEELDSFLINFVVEQTGYPEEIVELDADLEADLGIDSIKKAQLFGELSEHFDVTPDETLSLDDFPTLRHVKDFLSKSEQKPAPAVAAEPTQKVTETVSAQPEPATVTTTVAETTKSVIAEVEQSASPKMSSEELDSFLINFVVEQTGYPEEIVELDADLEADLGIDSIKKAQLFGELSEHFTVTADESLSLDDFPSLRHVKEYLLLNG